MSNLANLHEIDLNLWLEQMAIAVKNRDVNNMDWDNLFEEIEDMGASQKRALESYMQRLIEHILKLQYWHLEVERCRNGWQKEVTNFRNRVKRILKQNPSLKNYLSKEYESIFQDAIAVVRYDFDLPADSFVPLEKIMQLDYFGDD